MRRTASILICCALILLIGVAEAIAAGGANGPPPNSKSTGPAVSGTILISYGGSASDTFAIRLTKGTLQSGAVVISSLVILQTGGCTTAPTVLANRFLGGPSTPGGLLSSYFFSGTQDDRALLTEIFRELGITIVPGSVEPIITDVNNAVCSPAGNTGTLSLDVTIQFAVPK